MTFQERIFGIPKNPEIRKAAHDLSGGGTHHSERRTEQSELKLCTGFDTLLENLKKDPEILQERIKQLKTLPLCDGILGKLDSYFTQEHWEMIATLEAYDKPTFDHSLRVASFVYDMTLGGGETEAYIQSHAKMEQGSLKELFTAALFHDIGKTAIPQRLLHDNHSRREWAKRANDWAKENDRDHYFDSLQLDTLNDIELDYYFMQLHTMSGSDPLNIVPIEKIFSPEDLKELEQHGITSSDTFRKVLECHEKATKAILRRQKMYVASDIASHHHDYEGRPIRSERYPTETSALRLGFELSILRSMDVYDSLTSSDRSYKNAYHPLLALEIIIREAEAEFTDPELTKYLVRDLYKKLVASQENIPQNADEEQALKRILAFTI